MATSSTNRLYSYHFSLGDSTDGPVGYCARVIAESKEAAVDQLRAQLEGTGREQRVAGEARQAGELLASDYLSHLRTAGRAAW